MTQREDALKFEQGRIRALQEERLHIQKKTFTKWMNSFLQKARMEVEDLFVDLADGRRLLKLLEIISGERLPRPNSGRMRVHYIENVNKSLSFLHTKVRLESIGAEDIVDGNPRLILGLIWTIILRFQIQEIEIDVDEENESSEKKSAKDALLLWCQRKTSGYHGVHIHNFSDSWRDGLGFNALIHAHRPELFRWSEVPVSEPVHTLNHAFDVAHNRLGIPKLLDAEDVDTSRPDEKSVMTYVASYYHTFARMKNEQKSGKRIANIIGQMMDCDSRKGEYSRLMSALLEWIRATIVSLNDRSFPNSLDGIQRLLLAFKQYRTQEKPPKYKERSEVEALYFDINTMHKSLVGEAWSPLEGQLPQDLQRAWQQLEQAEHARELALRTELLRQQRLEQLNYKFNTKSVLRKGYLKEMIQVLSDPRYGSNLAQVDATVKKHEAISADILARTERFEDLSAMAAELVRENYHGAEAVSRTEEQVLSRWRSLLALLEKHREHLSRLAHLMALLREGDAVRHSLSDMKAQFQSEEVGRHLSDVERLLQAHALQELQLGALDDTIRRLCRQGNAAEGPEQPKKQLAEQLSSLEEVYDSLLAAARDRKARLEDARNLYQFLEDHDEEEAWVTEKQRICRTDVAAKDLRGVLALKQKHTALQHELKARDHVAQRHRQKGQSLIEAKHPKSAEIERRLSSLSEQWAGLRELADAREKRLADAAEAFQFYGDANEAESWMKEKRPLAGSADCGDDAPAATALLARHKALHEEIQAYKGELETLDGHAQKLMANGITQLQLPTSVESSAPSEQEEWVNETRLVPTEVWEQEPTERTELRTVTEKRTVPQVKALYPFSGQGISMAKDEVMFLISKSNPDWWSVRKADRSDGFVPANYVREIEPRTVSVQVRRPEKVRTVQRVKKTVLVKQVVPVRRSVPGPVRRASRLAQPLELPVSEKIAHLHKLYEELLELSASRREQLEDAIKLFSLWSECDDLERWMRDKERMLHDDKDETVQAARRNYEKFVTDLSAASRRLEQVSNAVEALDSSRHPQRATAVQRRAQLTQQWNTLLALKQDRERSLEGASSVELFGRTCDEALDWMSEKEQQLQASGVAGAMTSDLRTARALQRRHAQLERELEPLRDKLDKVALLADSVKSQYPSEKANVEARQREIEAVWQRCQAQAAERRRRLESAVGHQIFGNSSATLQDWLQKTRESLAVEVTAKDVATAEAARKQHHELLDDIKAHEDEYNEVLGLGDKLLANNPALSDVAGKMKLLRNEHDLVHSGRLPSDPRPTRETQWDGVIIQSDEIPIPQEIEWRAKDDRLKECIALAQFLKEAEALDAASSGALAYRDQEELGSTVAEAEALLKRHEELVTRLDAQEERVNAFSSSLTHQHYARDVIESRKKQVLSRREAVRQAAADRRRALQANLAHLQFLEAVDELQAWIQDKTRTATDQSYKDLSNLERKLQKHEAFERELHANEKQLRDVESVGESLQKSGSPRAAEIADKLSSLRAAWRRLVAASRDKGGKLRQASASRAHKRAVEEVRGRLSELERALSSTELGAELGACRRLMHQHQLLEQELSACEQKATALAAAGEDLVSGGHFDADNIQQSSKALLEAAAALKEPMAERKKALDTSMQLHKFAAEVSNELAWLEERRPAAESTAEPSDLTSAQSAVKKHAKLRAELKGRLPGIQRKVKRDVDHPPSDKIKELSAKLENAYAEVCEAAEKRAALLDQCLQAQLLLHEAREVESWLSDKAAVLSEPVNIRDRDRATQLLHRHKAVELELDTYSAIISEMKHQATSMESSGGAGGVPAGGVLVSRTEQLAESLARLQARAAARQGALLEGLCRHEYLAESAELEDWIQEQMAAASSEDYGQDYEHLLILRSKFEELRHRVESGAERFNQCEELAKKLLASESPYIPDIEKRQEALGESWQRLVEQIQSRATRLHAAAEIHRFHRDVAELISRAADKRSQLQSYTAAPSAAPPRDNIDNDLVAIDAQMQVLQEEGTRLQKLYPGGNVQQIELQQRALHASWQALQAAADERREKARRHAQLHQLRGQVRSLIAWSSSIRGTLSGPVRCRDAAACSAARAEHDALKADLDAREDSFREALDLGASLIESGHPDSQEISERCEALVAERGRLVSAWAARQVALDQLIDLACFLRDERALHDLCAAQEPTLSTEIPATLSVEEVHTQLKKHEALEKLLHTQDEKLSTLNSHGDKLLQQNHVESQRIADALQAINDRRKKVHALWRSRRDKLRVALIRAQFARDAAEARAWLAGKADTLRADLRHGEVSSLEDKIKKLQKHQAFKAEIAANKPRVKEIEALAQQLPGEQQVQETLQALQRDWTELLQLAEQTGRGLEEAQDILEFNQQLDKIEAWIRDKEMMVQAADVGRDYEHCSSLLRKLDDLDSDMQVDDRRVKAVLALAEKLRTQGPSGEAGAVSARRDAFLHKWRALQGALHDYRLQLTTALEIHAFNRDVQDTQERINSKAALFSSKQIGRDLEAAHELKRRHEALASEASAIRDKIRDLENSKIYKQRAGELQRGVAALRDSWLQLQELEQARTKLLDDALAMHKFDDSLKELELWVSEVVKRLSLDGDETDDQDLHATMQQLHETKAEIDGRQKSIQALKEQAEKQLSGRKELPEKLQKLHQLSQTLTDAWQSRNRHLTQALQLQQLTSQSRAVQDWLAEKEAFLNNQDLGENLTAVETLIRKHSEFSSLVESQMGRVSELEASANKLIQDGHASSGYIQTSIRDVQQRAHKLKESCASRAARLSEARQLQQLLRDLQHERAWIQRQMQTASDDNYKELSNLQSKIQKHAAFESELAANKGRIDDVVNTGEELIEANHYAANEIALYVEDLENQWRDLQEAAKLRRERLQEAYQARIYLRGLDDFMAWLDDVEAQLFSDDHGKDLASCTALVRKHGRLCDSVSRAGETAAQLAETGAQLAAAGHFMRDEIAQRAATAQQRYRQLQEPMQIRRDNLEDAAQLHRWERDADEEMRWYKEREGAVTSPELGGSLPEAQALLKKHVAIEAQLVAKEPTIKSLEEQAVSMSQRGHFAGAQLTSRASQLVHTARQLLHAAANRKQHLTDRIEQLQLLTELSEAHTYLVERRSLLTSSEHGRDEESVLSLQRRLDAQQRELNNFDTTVARLDKSVASLTQDKQTPETDQVKSKMAELRALYEELKLLSAKRERRLQQSLKYFKFVQECMETQEWISEQMSVAASEEYGLDVEHVDILQQHFDNFLQQLHANEGRIESVCEAGQTLIEENSPEQERVRQKIEDIRGLWEDLRELAAARQEALAGARQVHEFDRTADETVSWVRQKGTALETRDLGIEELHATRRTLDALTADLDAIKAARDKLKESANSLSSQFPDAREHVQSKLSEVVGAVAALSAHAQHTRGVLARAQASRALLHTYQELLAWCNETLARVTAPELAADVPAAERLIARHDDIRVEILAKDDDFKQLYEDGEKLIKEDHFMSAEISTRVSALRARRDALEESWTRRSELYARHLDALAFRRDADALDAWITSRAPLVRDGKLGDSVSQVEQLINRHRDLEETIHSQRDRVEALKRITLVEKAFQEQQEAEALARRRSEELETAQRVQEMRRHEVMRIEEQRRRERGAETQLEQQMSIPSAAAEESLSPAPQFEKLPKADTSAVKRAESMQVASTKTPKRTPSFTTRRRTQSFRRHQRQEGNLPPVEIEGYLERKQVCGSGGARAALRSWRGYHAVLCGQLLCYFRDAADFSAARAAAPPSAIHHARCEVAEDYTKRAHVFRLVLADGAEFLFSCSSRQSRDEWVSKVSFHAQLPPSLQLTPYGDDRADELRRRLHQNGSSSSSPTSSPEPRRTQAEILTQHRASQLPERIVESTVLPSLPPRQSESQEDVVMRNLDQGGGAWGRSRFSNGRDINAEFLRAQQKDAEAVPPLPPQAPPAIPERGPNVPERNANNPERQQPSVTALVNSFQQRMSRDNGNNGNRTSAPNWQGSERQNNNWQNVETTSHFYTTNEAYGSASNTRPASVAGSGGSPALDQRPASRSSGESELSVSGLPKEKKDKKGVFGGLFSRKEKKKRPQSHM